MNNVPIPARVEEVTHTLTPASGCTIEQVLADAKIMGAEKVEVINGKVVVTVYRRK